MTSVEHPGTPVKAPPVKLILVGGFLGAGKTTLLGQAATLLASQGKRVGLITNDQAENLVDTEMLRRKGFGVNEVAGGCFCCRFDDLVSSSTKLLDELKPDVLIGEPVGSCTDLSATVILPINAFHGDRIRAAPFSVLVDPERLRSTFDDAGTSKNPFSKKVCYIYGKQLEEADAIVINKSDTVSADDLAALKRELLAHFPTTRVFAMSALNGEGLGEWLAFVQGGSAAGQRVAEVDYDIYAEGEAELGWLNAAVQLNSGEPVDWKRFSLDLLKNFRALLIEKKVEAAHVKLALNARGVALVANLTSTKGQPFLLVQGTYEGATMDAKLVFNARVQTDPATLEALTTGAIEKTVGSAITAKYGTLQAFKPGRPVPIHRFAK